MLRRRTLFIVGAGASDDFGFPIGSELIGDLHKLLNLRDNTLGGIQGDQDLWFAIRERCEEENGDINEYLKVATLLRGYLSGSVTSIDHLVHSHSNNNLLADLARLAIARRISECERNSGYALSNNQTLREAPLPRGSWLDVLSTAHFRLNQAINLEDIFFNMAFISFNYDRCIEHCLRRSTAHYFGLDDLSSFELCKKIVVIHPYGSLGKLPDHSYAGEMNFGKNISTSSLVEMSKNIKTFTEGATSSEISAQITKMLNWSEVIVFLGFGYQALNLQLLGSVIRDGQPKILYGTAYKMTKPNADFAYNEVSGQFFAPNARPLDINLTASGLLKEYEFELFS
jgi:hypothetical protein